jgi:glucose-1-phosphate cytidylyltransferase
MKYYAHHGHKEFILCLGYRAERIKEYFLNYNEYLSNDFIMKDGEKELVGEANDIREWDISFVDTGLSSNVGQRLKAVESYLAGDDMFLANYADGLSSLNLSEVVDRFAKSDKVACLMCSKPRQTFHVVSLGGNGLVESLQGVSQSGLLINAGFFVFRRELFRYLRDGEDLVEGPFRRLMANQQLMGVRCDDFWCMDTFKEHQQLSDIVASGNAPWEVWKPRVQGVPEEEALQKRADAGRYR